MKPPRLSFAPVDWPAAIATLANADALPPAAMSAKSRLAGPSRAVPPALAQLNGVMSQQFAGLATSPVPVLLPFDVDALLRDQAAGAGLGRRRPLYVRLPRRPLLLSGSGRLRRRLRDPHERRPRTGRHQVRRPDRGADFRLGAALRARRADRNRRPAGDRPRGGVSRHPPDDPRAPSALHLRAFRRALCRVDRSASTPACRATSCRPAGPPIRLRSVSCVRCAWSAERRGRLRAAQIRCRSNGPTQVSRTFGYYGPGQLVSGTGFRGQGGRRTTPSIRRSAFRSRTRRPPPVPRCTSAASRAHAADPDDAARRPQFPGTTISANAAASRSANALPASGIRARTFARDRASRRPARSAARITATSSPPATASSCARHGRRRPISSSTPRTSTSGFATCT